MAQQIFAKASKDGKVIFEAAQRGADFATFESLIRQFGDFPYLVTPPTQMKSLVRISDRRLQAMIAEVEQAAKGYFGPTYRVEQFVLVGDFEEEEKQEKGFKIKARNATVFVKSTTR